MENLNNHAKKFVKLKRDGNSYRLFDRNDLALSYLAEFLSNVSPSGPFYDFYADWLSGKSEHSGVGGNIYTLNEIDGKVHISHCFSIEGYETVEYITTKGELLSILKRWIDVARTEWIFEDGTKVVDLPEEILFTQEGSTVTITRSDDFEPDDYYHSEAINSK